MEEVKRKFKYMARSTFAWSVSALTLAVLINAFIATSLCACLVGLRIAKILGEL